MCTSDPTDRHFGQLNIRDRFSTVPDIRSQLHPGTDRPLSTQTVHNALQEVQLHARYQQQGYRSSLKTGIDALPGVIIVPGPSNSIGYCSQINLVFVCGGMMAVDVYGREPENATK
ncbi:hypothetical protein TNCV_4627521 [Trichonephila clavipes]|nr:hypothetical protein TNCV_4627521 [Trichonephila clavipes]